MHMHRHYNLHHMLFYLYMYTSFILPKLNKTSNSMICTSKHELKLGTPSFDSNSKYFKHRQTMEFELDANLFPY
jgi:hypothetical protein